MTTAKDISPTTQPPATLRSMAGLPSSPPAVADSTIVVIDAQHEYLATGALALPDVDAASSRIAAVLASARQTGAPVVHIVQSGLPGGLFDPAAGGRIIDAAMPLVSEEVVLKTLPNSFAATDLEVHLKSLGDRPLVIVGFMTHMCVSATARTALDLGFTATVLSDATATRTLPSASGNAPIPASELHEAALAALADRFSIVATSDRLLV